MVLPQYDEKDDKAMELSELLAFLMSAPSPTPTLIWWMVIPPLEITPELTPVEITPVGASLFWLWKYVPYSKTKKYQ